VSACATAQCGSINDLQIDITIYSTLLSASAECVNIGSPAVDSGVDLEAECDIRSARGVWP
jgi:hypothetical protein